MTLAQLIEAHEQRRPQPVSSRAVLTPRGDAAVAVYRLGQQLAALEPDDRHAVLALLRGLVADVDRTA
jgi:hypothetical protein